MRRARRRTALVGAVLVAAAGCGGGSSPEPGASTTTEAPTAEDDVGARSGEAIPGPAAGVDTLVEGALTACVVMPFPPFALEGPDGPTGFDVELLRAVAEEVGLDLIVNESGQAGILGGPEAGECDIVAAALTITDERARDVLFSDPYLEVDQSLLVRRGDTRRLASLGGRPIGVLSGSTGDVYAVEHAPSLAEIVPYATGDALYDALVEGAVDAVVHDLSFNAHEAASNRAVEVVETFPTDERYGFAMALGAEDLAALVDGALDAVKADRTYAALHEEWFGSA